MHEPAHGTLEVGKPKIKEPSGNNEQHPKPEQSCSLEMICTTWPFLPAGDPTLSISVHATSSRLTLDYISIAHALDDNAA